MSAADADALGQLHNTLAEKLTEALTNGEVIEDKEGNALRVTASPAMLNVARQFLKDNDIKALPADGSALGKLVGVASKKLPFEGDPSHTH